MDDKTLDGWKRKFGKVYQLEDYIFRALTIAEYETIQNKHVSSAEIEEAIVEAAVLDPSPFSFDDLPAGLVSELADQITNISGFGDPQKAKKLLDEKRVEAQNVYALMKAMVLATMPAYTEEMLDDFTFSDLVAKVALAEQVIQVQQAVLSGSPVTLELIDPEEEQVKHEKAAAVHNARRKPGTAVYDDPIAQRLKQALR